VSGISWCTLVFERQVGVAAHLQSIIIFNIIITIYYSACWACG